MNARSQVAFKRRVFSCVAKPLRSEALLNDLIAIEPDGFLNFRWEAERWLNDMRSWRAAYINSLQVAILYHRNSTGSSRLTEVLADYADSQYTLGKVRKDCEMRQDTIMNLKAMVTPLLCPESVQQVAV